MRQELVAVFSDCYFRSVVISHFRFAGSRKILAHLPICMRNRIFYDNTNLEMFAIILASWQVSKI